MKFIYIATSTLILFFSIKINASEIMDKFLENRDDFIVYSQRDLQNGVHQIYFSSGIWEKANPQKWDHILNIVVPSKVENDPIFIAKGGVSSESPDRSTQLLCYMARNAKSVIIELRRTLMQPLKFAADEELKDDAIIAYSWTQFYETEDPEWIAQLPMIRAIVRGIDAFEMFASDHNFSSNRITLVGTSKHGYVAWHVGFLDMRVNAVVPIVCDMLDFKKSLTEQKKVYGEYSEALKDYEARGLLSKLEEGSLDRLISIIDPIEFLDSARKDLKILMINAANDEFFLPDSCKFYGHKLTENINFKFVPNSGHRVNPFTIMKTVKYFNANKYGLSKFNEDYDGFVVSIDSESEIKNATFWYANSTTRDFRYKSSSVYLMDYIWPFYPWFYSVNVTLNNKGRSIKKSLDFKKGWNAFFMEIEFVSGESFTSQFRVVNQE